MLPILGLNGKVKNLQDLTEMQSDSTNSWKYNPELMSYWDSITKSNGLLPPFFSLEKNKQPRGDWVIDDEKIMRLYEPKRNGNRNFQTQGW